MMQQQPDLSQFPRRKAIVDALGGEQAPAPGGGVFSSLMGPDSTRGSGIAPPAASPQALPGASPIAQSSSGGSPFAFGRDSVSNILGGYDHTPAGLQKAFSEHPELSGISKIGGSKGDKILDPTSGRYIDVIQAAGDGGKAWQWLDDAGGGGAPMAPGMTPSVGGIDSMLQGNSQQNIQSALGSLSQSGLLQRLIAQLRGGQ